MELTIEHLAPYLPYSLQFSDDETDPVSGVTGTMIELSNIAAWVKPDAGIKRLELPIKKHSIGKPLLRPSLTITEQIEQEGEIFSPYKKALEIYPNSPNFEYLLKANSHTVYSIYETNIEHCIFELLLKWHFDVFGLIENNLAIDKRLQE